MFPIERLNKIKEMLLEQKRVDVYELSEKFSVTEVTIRRDLDKLEQTGFLVKSYGGAVLNDKLNSVPAAVGDAGTDQKYAEEKRMIGKIAAQMVEDGEAIFLSAGSTCLEIARNIKDKKITVLTNDLAIGLELKDASGVKTIVIGGDLVPSSTMLVGGFALQMLKGIYVNKAFLSVKGAMFDAGYTVSHYEEAMILHEIAKISSEIIIVADCSKFNVKGFAKLGDLTMAKKVITNTQIPADYKKYYFEQAVKLYTTFDFR